MLDVGDEGTGDVPVLLDFGSMGEARVDVANISQARALQVQLRQLNWLQCMWFYTLLEFWDIFSINS